MEMRSWSVGWLVSWSVCLSVRSLDIAYIEIAGRECHIVTFMGGSGGKITNKDLKSAIIRGVSMAFHLGGYCICCPANICTPPQCCPTEERMGGMNVHM
jgi:hypothetical protein